MKKMMFYFIFLSLMGCKKEIINDCAEPTFDVNTARSLILGKWEWKITYYFDVQRDSNVILTPKNQKVERRMEFKKDGNLSVFENGSLILETPYVFVKDTSNIGFDPNRYFTTWNRSRFAFKICSEYLYLNSLSIKDNQHNEVWVRL
jgi:hypothetical protein